jgi:preprotein translocase subunit YajC
MKLPTLADWPVTLAQADNSPPPADTSPPPTADTPTTPATPGTPGTGAPGDAPSGPAPSPFGGILLPMILVLAVLFIFSMSSGRKEKKRRAQMISDLKKGAKIQTAGGVLGTIVEVRDDEVLVKVDENSNTRMRFAKSAVTAVISEE